MNKNIRKGTMYIQYLAKNDLLSPCSPLAFSAFSCSNL
ncbi:hypothetical protein X975_01192, partial [Stegodyphus mimosarum]